ncbi:MAG TPA: carboxypeptidase regulatory-like domain-containing protein [Thermoanaerobaculia bacterium]|nr:carboxypeptidase regulatory-like domain-containing protein [Thermoanaerobaculia bacterium]
MRRCSATRVLATGVALLLFLFASASYAQIQTGNIYGHVKAKDGSLLPGVTVTLTGVGAPQTFVTDATGDFRFLNLSPGTYNLKAELAGFGTAMRSGLTINIGRNSDVTMMLNPAASESITVSAEAPLLDVRRTGTGATVTKVELEKVPSGRDPWVILQQTPGVLMDRINVGGSESGQQSNYVGKGATGDQSTWNVDGVNITDVGALGSSPTYYDFDSFEEMQVTTGGTDPRIMTPGVQLNMVTKRGTNDIRGSGRYYKTPHSLQSDPSIPSEAVGYLSKVNEIHNIGDYGGEAGGPILRDRLWLWAGTSKQLIKLFVAQPVGQEVRYTDNTELTTKDGKLNAQILTSNSFTYSVMRNSKIKIGRNASPTRPPETTYNQGDNFGGPNLWKIEDTQIFGNRLYLTGLLSHVQGGFQLIGNNGKDCRELDCAIAADVQPSYFDASGSAHRSYLSYFTQRPQKLYRLDGSTFFDTGNVNNELKFGFGHRNAGVRSLTAWPGDQVSFFEGVDINGNDADAGDKGAIAGAQLMRRDDFTYTVKQDDFYVGDTILMGNLSLQVGARYDVQKANFQSGGIPANPVIPDILPAISFRGSDIPSLKWTSIAPRIGLTYTLGSEKKTLLRAAANRYTDQMGGTMIYFASPVGYQYLYYYYADLNGDKKAQRNELCGSAGVDCSDAGFDNGIISASGLDPNKLNVANQVSRWDHNMKAPYADELMFGVEHELLSDFTVGANVTYRKSKDFIAFRPEKHQGQGDFYTSADYEVVRHVTGKLPDGTAYDVPVYGLKSGVAAPIYYVITNIDGYSQTYKGLELNATKRMSNRWMMRGNISFNDWTQDVSSSAIWDPTRLRGSTVFAAPNIGNSSGCSVCNGGAVVQGSGSGSGAKGGVYINSKWAFNFTGAYQIPVIETSAGFNISGRQGYPIPWVHRAGTSEGTKNVLINPETDTDRLKSPLEVDARLAKDIRVSRVGLTISADVFNILNSHTILQRNTRLGTNTRNELYDPVARPTRAGNRITEIQSPRVIRLGARLTF